MLRWLLFFFSLILMVSISSIAQNEFLELLPHHVVSIAWNTQGTQYATGQADGTVRLYDRSGLLLNIPDSHSTIVRALSFSPDGSQLATGGSDYVLRIWDTVNGEMIAEFEVIGSQILSIVWIHDTIRAIPDTGNDTLISVDFSSDGYTINNSTRIASSEDVVMNSDNTALAFAGVGSDVLIVEPLSFSIVRNLDATPDTDFFYTPNEFTVSVAWHPDARIVANGKINGWIHIWDLDSDSNTIPLLSLQANDGVNEDALIPFEHAVQDINFSDDGQTISSVSSDGTFRTWNSQTGELLTDTILEGAMLSSAFSPDGSQLIYTTYSSVDIAPVAMSFEALSCLESRISSLLLLCPAS